LIQLLQHVKDYFYIFQTLDIYGANSFSKRVIPKKKQLQKIIKTN